MLVYQRVYRLHHIAVKVGSLDFLHVRSSKNEAGQLVTEPVYCQENHTVYAPDILPGFSLKNVWYYAVCTYHDWTSGCKTQTSHTAIISYLLAVVHVFVWQFPHENAPQNKSTKGSIMALRLFFFGHDMEDENPDSLQGSVPTMWPPPVMFVGL